MKLDHIVIINDISQPKGGATALALSSALYLRRRGFAVTFISGDSGNNSSLQEAGVTQVALGQDRLTSSSAFKAFANGIYNAASAAMVSDWINCNDQPTMVYHVHGWSQILSPSLFKALANVSDRLILSAHDFFLACPNGSFSLLQSGQVCPLRPLSAKCVATQCDRRNYAHKLWRVVRQATLRHYHPNNSSIPILAIHEAMRPFLMRAGFPASAVSTLRNPVVPYSRDRVLAHLNHLILFVGRLESTKGPDLAAEAARHAGARIIFIGDGALRPMLEARYPEMQFVGHQPPARIAEYARAARFLVMPSRYPEPFGLAAVEALWSGLPVVTADTAFLAPEIVAAGAGLSVDVRNKVAFGDAISRLMADDTDIERMSVAAYTDLPGIALRPEDWVDGLIASYMAVLDVAERNGMAA